MAETERAEPLRRRLKIIAWATAPLAGLGLISALAPRPALLWNTSESEPKGLYLRTPERVRTGRVIAFRAPDLAFPYADGRMGYLRRVPILKQVAASAGDEVCTQGGSLRINGRWRAPVLVYDPRGKPLPRWRACRRLRAGEFFVFSDLIPNSFDSRYYGPVRIDQVVGVFRPLLIEGDVRRAS